MIPRLPARAAEAAMEAGLGRRTDVFRSLRSLPTRTMWLIAVGACIVSIFAVVWLGAAGLLLMPVVLALLAAYRYLLPPAPGWRWFAVHEQGFVDVPPPDADGAAARVARWSEVTAVELEHYPIDGFTLSLAPPEQVSLTDLAPRAALIDTIASRLPGSIPPARRSGWEQREGRNRITALALGALLLVPLLGLAARSSSDQPDSAVDNGAGQVGAFDPYVTQPTYSAPPYSPTTEYPTPETSFASPIPKDRVGYGDVCTGAVFSEAPAYGGKAPHYIFISYMSEGDAFMDTPSSWEPSDVTKVQLVACVKWSAGARLRACRYEGDHGKTITQKMVRTTWDITIRETRTGRTVAHHRFVGGNTGCDPSILTFGGTADPRQYADPTQRQIKDAIGRYVG